MNNGLLKYKGSTVSKFRRFNVANNIACDSIGIIDLDAGSDISIAHFYIKGFTNLYMELWGGSVNNAFYTEMGLHNHYDASLDHTHTINGITNVSGNNDVTHTHNITTGIESNSHTHSGTYDPADVLHSHIQSHQHQPYRTEVSGDGYIPNYSTLHYHTVNYNGGHSHSLENINDSTYESGSHVHGTFYADDGDHISNEGGGEYSDVLTGHDSVQNHRHHAIPTSVAHTHTTTGITFNSGTNSHWHYVSNTQLSISYLQSNATDAYHSHTITTIGASNVNHTHAYDASNGSATNESVNHKHSIDVAIQTSSYANRGSSKSATTSKTKFYLNDLTISIYNFSTGWVDITSTLLTQIGWTKFGDGNSTHVINSQGTGVMDLSNIVTRSNFSNYNSGGLMRFKFVQSGTSTGRLHYKIFC